MAYFSENIINEIKENSDIVDWIGRTLPLKRSGMNYTALCPFHKEKTPSFMVSPQKQIFHCFGCHLGGNIFTYIMHYENITFPEAIKKVAEYIHFDLSKVSFFQKREYLSQKEVFFELNNSIAHLFHQNLEQSSLAKSYLKFRKINQELVKKFYLGYAYEGNNLLQKIAPQKKEAIELGLLSKKTPHYDTFQNRLIFPIHNASGVIIGFGGRQISPQKKPKYLNSPESAIYKKSFILYGLYQALKGIRHEKSCFLVEGYMDVLRFHQYSFTNVVATCGTALTKQHTKILSRYCTKVFCVYDGDDAGIQATIKSIPILLKQKIEVKIVPIPNGLDPDSFLQKFGKEKMNDMISHSLDYIDFQWKLYEKRGALKSTTEQAKLAKKLLEQTEIIPDTVLKNINMNRIKKRFNLSQNTVQSFYSSVPKTNIRVPNNTNPLKKIFENIEQKAFYNERTILSFFFSLNLKEQLQLIPKLQPDLFLNPYLIKLVNEIHNQFDDTGSFSLELIQKSDSSGFFKAFIEKAMMEPFKNNKQFISEILRALEIRTLNKKIKTLQTSSNKEDLVLYKQLQQKRSNLKK